MLELNVFISIEKNFVFLFYPLWSETWHRKIPQCLKIVQQETGHVRSDPKSPYTLLKYRREREGSQLLRSALLPTEVTDITMSHAGITARRSAQCLAQGRGIRQRRLAYWVAWHGPEFHVPNPSAPVLSLMYKRDNFWQINVSFPKVWWNVGLLWTNT